ncbi:MAG: hypothetical protein H6Q55_3794 [Deltaproteobacteria bacterium]|nr:hypothetical protein [Deltaproteobacteria bacterium]
MGRDDALIEAVETAGLDELSTESIGQILRESGISNLTAQSSAEDRMKALRVLAVRTKAADRILLTNVREEVIKKLGSVGVKSAAGMVNAVFDVSRNGNSTQNPTQGAVPLFAETIPWESPIDGAALLDEIVGLFRKYAVLPNHIAETLALWVMHTYLLDAADVTPYLLINSAVKRSGKSRVLEVLECLAHKPLKMSDATVSGIFRTIEKYHPTILLDEADAFLREHEDMRGLLNDGARRGAKVLRTVGDNFEPMVFDAFSPKAIAGIGSFEGRWATVADRSIKIRMQRKSPGERVARFRVKKAPHETLIFRRKLLRWATDHRSTLHDACPNLPEELNDREQDCWEPLLAIADCIGGEWPKKARAAALGLSDAAMDDPTTSVGELLLRDISAVFDETGLDAIPSGRLCTHLAEKEERPWPEWYSGKPISPRQLASQLRAFEIKPEQVWGDGKNQRGYRRESFADAWSRYTFTENPSKSPVDPLGPLGFNRINDLSPEKEVLGNTRLADREIASKPCAPTVLAVLADRDAKSERLATTAAVALGAGIPTQEAAGDLEMKAWQEHDRAIDVGQEEDTSPPRVPDGWQRLRGSRCPVCKDVWKARRGPNLALVCMTCHPPA